jgi:hypothetical protein
VSAVPPALPTTWYHGSPYALTTLRPGSTITPDRHLATVFSHKPAVVSIDDDGAIRHNGVRAGYLYIVDEEVGPGDVCPHPRSSVAAGLEWLTTRELALRLAGPTAVMDAERLTEEEIARLLGGRAPSG